MIAEKDKVVTFHYTLTNAEGELMESSREKDPMVYLHGANNIITGLEKAMDGYTVGDTISATLEPEDAYGTRNEQNVQRFFSYFDPLSREPIGSKSDSERFD